MNLSNESSSLKAESPLDQMALSAGEEDPIFFAEYFLGLHLNPFQKRALLSLCTRKKNKSTGLFSRFFKQIIWVTANQVGKSQWVEEPVLTPNGFVRMGDIKVGSKVYSQNGKETKVVGVYPQGKRKLYKMIFDDSSSLVVDEEHLWRIKTPFSRFVRKKYKNHKQEEWQTMTTRQLIDRWGMNPSPNNRIEIPMTEPVEFEKKETKIEPYLLGLLLGDGCFRKKGSPVFSTVDVELLDAFGEIKYKDGCDYQLYDLARPIKELGLYNKKSWEKFIPKNYLLNDKETRLSILQGLMDTDGSIYGKCIMEYCTVSEQLAKDVQFLVRSLGGKAIIKSRYTYFTYKGKKKRGRKSYRVSIKIQNLCPFRLKRKSDRFYKINRTKNRILYKIEYFGKKDAQCIRVDNSTHLYLAKDFIVTHNTVSLAVSHIWFNYYKKGFSGDPSMVDKARYETLNISPVSRQATEAFRYVEEMLNSKFSWEEGGKRYINECRIEWFWQGKNENIGRIDFSNNSSMWCLSTASDQGSGLAGKQFAYISYDECVQCYSEDTEVLTEKGWKRFNEVRIGDLVQSLNKKNNKVELVKTEKVIWEDYSGEMFRFGGNNNKVDLLVTPNHKMLIKESLGANQYGELKIKNAENLIDKHFQLSQDFNWKGKEKQGWIIPVYSNNKNYKREKKKIPINDFLTFLGFYISEGCCDKNRVQIAQLKKTKGYEPIKQNLDALGFSYKYKKDVFQVFDKQLTEYIRGFVKGKSFEKRIPREILELDKKHLKYLFVAMMLGDGSGGRIYGTSSRGLANDFSELCLKLGYVPTIKEHDDRGKVSFIRGHKATTRHKFYIISIRFGEKYPRINHHKKTKWATVQKEEYNGKIGCLALEKNHIMFVRKNGRVCWSGNSHHLEEELGARIFSRTAKYSGWIVLVSTPDEMGKSQQYWYHLYTQSKREKNEKIIGDWYLIEGLYDENIFIPEEKRSEFKERLKKLSPAKYNQVIMGLFVDAADRMFSLRIVERMWNDKNAPTDCIAAKDYVLIIDWGVADSGDETVMMIGDITDSENIEVVKAYSKQGGDPVELMAMAGYLHMEYNDCPIVMDAAEMGGIIFKKMMKQFSPISFGQGNKPDALFYLLLMLKNNVRKNSGSGKVGLTSSGKSATGKIKSYYLPKLEKQLSSYKLDDKKIKQDWVMVLAMLAWYFKKYKMANKAKIYSLKNFYK